jgi:hypothetical protein
MKYIKDQVLLLNEDERTVSVRTLLMCFKVTYSGSNSNQ